MNCDNIARKIAFIIPRKIVYQCGMRIWGYGTTGKYQWDNSTSIFIDKLMSRWEDE